MSKVAFTDFLTKGSYRAARPAKNCFEKENSENNEDASKLRIMIINMMMMIIVIINMIIIIIMIGLCDKEGGFEEGSEANAVAVCHSTRK